MTDDWQKFNNDISISSDIFTGGFIDEPQDLWMVVRLSMLGQTVLSTPRGLAELWDVEPRVVGKVVDRFAKRTLVDVSGSGWVREISVSKAFIISKYAAGSTQDLGCTLSYGWKLPDGPVSLWRGRGLPNSVRDAVFRRDGKVCAYCKATDGKFHIDHINPVAKGGTDNMDNLTVACQGCNLAKSDMALEAFIGKTR